MATNPQFHADSSAKATNMLIYKLFANCAPKNDTATSSNRCSLPTTFRKPPKSPLSPLQNKMKRRKLEPQKSKLTHWFKSNLEDEENDIVENKSVQDEGTNVARGKAGMIDLDKSKAKKRIPKLSPKFVLSKVVRGSKEESAESSTLKENINTKKSKKGRIPRRKKDTDYEAESYKKYGCVMPTVDQRLNELKDLEEYRKQIQEAESVFVPDEPSLAIDLDETSSEEDLDCKEMDLSEISDRFTENCEFLRQIVEEEVECDRHALYNKENVDKSLLKGSVNTLVFTFDQIEKLVDLMELEFDEALNYYLQVLVPECCLKIFMDKHKMGKDQAVRYLENRKL